MSEIGMLRQPRRYLFPPLAVRQPERTGSIFKLVEATSASTVSLLELAKINKKIVVVVFKIGQNRKLCRKCRIGDILTPFSLRRFALEDFLDLPAHFGRSAGSRPERPQSLQPSAAARFNRRFWTSLSAFKRLGPSHGVVTYEGGVGKFHADLRRSAGCGVCSKIDNIGNESFFFIARVPAASD